MDLCYSILQNIHFETMSFHTTRDTGLEDVTIKSCVFIFYDNPLISKNLHFFDSFGA